MDEFISENKKQINLPVPLGSIIYSFTIECGDFCLFQKEKFEKLKKENPNQFGCNYNTVCKTRVLSIQKHEFNMENIGIVLKKWNKKYFATSQEASQVAKNLIAKNRKLIKEYGLEINDEGYSTIKNKKR